jgi:glycyl-tRNA synthetase beta chain
VADLLLEIGIEEIPARFLTKALADLPALAAQRLGDARLAFTQASALGAPRRLALLVRGLADRQPDVSERVAGPPVSAAYDKEGKPTKAAIGFAQRNGVDVGALERGPVEGKKGEYILCNRFEAGRPAVEVLPAILLDLIRAIPWPKSMRWADNDESFVRPVHWIVALLDDRILPIELIGIRSGNVSRGHRFLAPGPVTIATPDAYAEALRKAFVVVDPALRAEMIRGEFTRVERETGLVVRPDETLLAEVQNLVEYPTAVTGAFDPAFLEVPAEVIITALRAHQRYFVLEDKAGKLANRFVTIAGTVTRDVAKVQKGNERASVPRLSDARFFFREDQKQPLERWGEKLDGVVFQAKLGTIGAKVKRILADAEAIAPATPADRAQVRRAAALAKADLTTGIVGEFPELQGVMGGHYARLQGEPAPVWRAIADHYLPRGAGDRLPPNDAAGDVAAVVGLADRADTLVGCFAVGLAPSGSADPYGLRRAALGILAVLLDRGGRGWTLTLPRLVDIAAAGLAGTVAVTDAVKAEVLAFLETRLRGVLIEGQGLPADCVDAALAAGAADPVDARSRADAVAKLRARADFEPLAVAFKRVGNILKGEAASGTVDPKRFREEAERGLWDAFGAIRSRAEEAIAGHDYHRGLQILSELKAPVDLFFDKVLVMDKDDAVKRNRLALLGSINATFLKIADFRMLAVQT